MTPKTRKRFRAAARLLSKVRTLVDNGFMLELALAFKHPYDDDDMPRIRRLHDRTRRAFKLLIDRTLCEESQNGSK
jgi:hypothetical protein